MKNINYILCILLLVSACETQDDTSNPILEEEQVSSEIFFSEYIEGTSFNKALEIVNLTGASVNLEEEGYTIKKQSNGAGNWISELPLKGNLAHQEVFVIANDQANETGILDNANQLKTGAPMDYNGNDPVGLFKNGDLIDIIGQYNNPNDFAKDMSMRRKKEITEPSTSFDMDQWEIFETNNTENLGRH